MVKKIYKFIQEGVIDMSNPLKESLKELGRLILFAVASVVVTYLLNTFAELPQNETVIILTAVLKWADKYLHERAKEVKNARLKGLSFF